MRIVGMIGPKGHGKDTAAEALIAKGWLRASFADPLYNEVAQAFGVSRTLLEYRLTKETPLPALALSNCNCAEFVQVMLKLEELALGPTELSVTMAKPRSPREVLQVWGTEFRRELYSADYWRSQVRAKVQSEPGASWVITDVRYPNEAELLREMGGESCKLARVVRPSLMAALDIRSMHKSEVSMLTYPVDVEFENHDDKINELKASVVSSLH